MTVVDHPMRRVADLNRRIAFEVGSLTCWKVDLLWDEYLALEFGERHVLIGKDGPAAFGEFRIVFDDARWIVERDGALWTSDDEASNDRATLDEAFIDRRLVRVERGAGLDLIFSDGFALRCGPSDGGPLFELRFANGDYVDCYADGVVETESSIP